MEHDNKVSVPLLHARPDPKEKHLLLFGQNRKELSWPLREESRKMARSLAFSHITRPKEEEWCGAPNHHRCVHHFPLS